MTGTERMGTNAARAMVFGIGCACALVLPVAAAEPDSAKPPEDARLTEMRERVSRLTATIGEGDGRMPLAGLEEPLLRYNDPARDTTDGSVWAFGATGRPRALLTLAFEPTPNGPGKWSYEFVSLSASPPRIASGDDWDWTPSTSDLALQPLPEAGRPGPTASRRLTQMKSFARRFSTTEAFLGEEYRLRLAPREIHRYADPNEGVVDGALFVYSYGTNPEVLLVLECRRVGDVEAWHYGFARLSAAKCTAHLGEDLVWERANVDKSVKTEPYFIQFVAHEPDSDR